MCDTLGSLSLPGSVFRCVLSTEFSGWENRDENDKTYRDGVSHPFGRGSVASSTDRLAGSAANLKLREARGGGSVQRPAAATGIFVVLQPPTARRWLVLPPQRPRIPAM